MLGYKGSQSVKQPYDRYRDTEPYNVGDQLVDFSKRYPENDPEEVCRPSPAKNSQLSPTSIKREKNKQPEDEVIVYCVEGTPGMESFASSCSDLSAVGIMELSSEALVSEVQTGKDCCFSSPHFSIGTPDSTKNCIDSNLVAYEAEKRESNSEEDCINQTEAVLTKASTPLMFSRSSSIGSLNSFEQQSIVDDRSSVSAFSNLASGLISPSEIPDSPGEVQSPFISKGKNSEFIFPNSDKSVGAVLIDQTIRHEDFPDEAFGDLSDDLIVYDDEGDCPSVSSLSALSIQADSTLESISKSQIKNKFVCLTLKSSVTLNCSITDGEADFIGKCQNLKNSDESYIPETNCINAKSSLPSDVTDISQSEKPLSIIEITYEDKGTSTSEDFNIQDSKLHRALNKTLKKYISVSKEAHCQQEEGGQLQNASFQQMVKDLTELVSIKEYNMKPTLQNNSSYCSKDDSDDDSDSILEECILSGMPSNDSSVFNDSKQALNHSFQTSGSSLKDDVPNSSLSDNDISGDEEEILNGCVLLGMPQQANNVQIEAEQSSIIKVASCSNVTTTKSSISNSANHQLKLFDETYQSTVDDIKEDLAKSDDDSDIDESDLLVEQLIQLGKYELRNPQALAETKLCVIPPSNKALGCRDNWPDGVSDGDDDDDDILNEIIKAGKPDSNSEVNKTPYAEPKPCLKSQNQRKLTAAEDRALYLNKDYYGNISKEGVRTFTNTFMGIDDSMCIYRTEDTPILSPSASLSDLSTLSFTEDKVCQESFLNNSRNSDCSSESEDDEMLLQCIRQGMP